MAFYDSFSTIDWILVLMIFIFLLLIIRNVYRLMKKRNEYISFKEARAQYNKEQEEEQKSESENHSESLTDSEER
jgi:hypothetical protein